MHKNYEGTCVGAGAGLPTFFLLFDQDDGHIVFSMVITH